MKYVWIIALCASFILLGCQSEKEEVVQPQASVSKESKTEAAKAAEVAKAAEIAKAASKTTTAVKVASAVAVASNVSVPAVIASAGDVVNGRKLTRRCKSCHSFKADGRQMTGPNLFGVYGRGAGKNTAFSKYSGDLKNATFKWDETSLAAWVCSSKEAIKTLTGNAAAKTRMPVQKKCGQKGQDIAAYLKSLK